MAHKDAPSAGDGNIEVPGFSGRHPEMYGDKRAVYYCNLHEQPPKVGKGETAVGMWCDDCGERKSAEMAQLQIRWDVQNNIDANILAAQQDYLNEVEEELRRRGYIIPPEEE